MPDRAAGAMALFLTITLALTLACSESSASEPTPGSTTTVLPQSATLEPTRRTLIPTLNPRQVEGTREAKVSEIKT